MCDVQFVGCNDPVLETTAKTITSDELKDEKMQRLIDAMLSFAKGEQTDRQRSILVGLAAPQIGKAIRIILVDLKANGKGEVAELRPYINPEILAMSEETEQWYEGCYSTGDIKGVVTRPSKVTIQAWDREGNTVIETHTGYVARIFQHEIDHLNGIRFPDRVSEQESLHIVKSEEMHLYRNQQAWRDWKVTMPQKDWKEYLQSLDLFRN